MFSGCGLSLLHLLMSRGHPSICATSSGVEPNAPACSRTQSWQLERRSSLFTGASFQNKVRILSAFSAAVCKISLPMSVLCVSLVWCTKRCVSTKAGPAVARRSPANTVHVASKFVDVAALLHMWILLQLSFLVCNTSMHL